MNLLYIAIQIFTFALAALIAIALFQGAESILKVRRRLSQQEAPYQRSGGVMRSQDLTNPFLKWVQDSTSLKDFKDRAKIAQDLAQAGFEQPAAPALYVLARFALAIGLPVLFLLSQPLFAKPPTSTTVTAVTLLLAGFGLIAPRAFLDRRIGQRREQMEHEFPDTLDLLVVCVEAGLGLESAFVRVGQEVRESHPRTAFEFGRLAEEMAAGRGRADALRAMAGRIGVETVKSFVALVIQTDQLGVSIGQTLRTYSVEMREHRMLKAEEKAARVPVLMTAPLVVCILPVIVAALLLPAIIDVIRTLLPALRGQGG